MRLLTQYPYAYIASVRPELLRDHSALAAEATRLAVQEAFRRPGFHFARIVSWMCTFAVEGESKSLYWSLADHVLPQEFCRDRTLARAIRGKAAKLSAAVQRPLHLTLATIHGLFLAALIIGLRQRNVAIVVLGAAVILKYGFHALTAVQGRYFLAATALELLTIAVATHAIRTAPMSRSFAVALAPPSWGSSPGGASKQA